MESSVEFLLVIVLLAVFVGPSAYRLYERYKRARHGGSAPEPQGPSYTRRMLGMLGPVFVLLAFLVLLAVGLELLAR